MPKVTQAPRQKGDFLVDYEEKVFEDVKAEKGEKALVTFHTVAFEGSIGFVNLLQATRLQRKGYATSVLPYGPGVTLGVQRGFPTLSDEAFAGHLNVVVPGPVTQSVAQQARAHGMVVVLGVNERDHGSLYNTQLVFDADGQLLLARRKITPTYHERMVWGMGDAAELKVVQTAVAQGIAAPPASTYAPVWEPPAERTALPLAGSGIGSVIWCIGFAPDFAWVDAPVFNGRGDPQHLRGVTREPGLYFLGLPWLHTWGSGRFSGVARDAHYVAEQIEARRVAQLPVEARAIPAKALAA